MYRINVWMNGWMNRMNVSVIGGESLARVESHILVNTLSLPVISSNLTFIKTFQRLLNPILHCVFHPAVEIFVFLPQLRRQEGLIRVVSPFILVVGLNFLSFARLAAPRHATFSERSNGHPQRHCWLHLTACGSRTSLMAARQTSTPNWQSTYIWSLPAISERKFF